MSKSLIITNIETSIWNSILGFYLKSGWKIKLEYNQFDKGIDLDFYDLFLDNNKISFAWDNWCEGEIKCSKEEFAIIKNNFDYDFKMDEPEHLSIGLIEKIKSLSIRKN